MSTASLPADVSPSPTMAATAPQQAHAALTLPSIQSATTGAKVSTPAATTSFKQHYDMSTGLARHPSSSTEITPAATARTAAAAPAAPSPPRPASPASPSPSINYQTVDLQNQVPNQTHDSAQTIQRPNVYNPNLAPYIARGFNSGNILHTSPVKTPPTQKEDEKEEEKALTFKEKQIVNFIKYLMSISSDSEKNKWQDKLNKITKTTTKEKEQEKKEKAAEEEKKRTKEEERKDAAVKREREQTDREEKREREKDRQIDRERERDREGQRS